MGTIGCELMEYSVALPTKSLPGLGACSYGGVNTCSFSEYWPTSGNFFYQKYLEYVSEIWQDYCLDVWVSVFKRISL